MRKYSKPKAKLPAAFAASLRPQERNIEFVELLGRSYFSFLRGASSPEEMLQQSIENGYQGLALCDLNGLYGVVRAYHRLKNPSYFTIETKIPENFRFHVGAEVQIEDKSSFTLLPMNKYGYANLCQLITKVKMSAKKGYSTLRLEDILKYSDDLILFALPPWNINHLKLLKNTIFDRLYLPVWKDYTWESVQFYSQGLEIEKNIGIPLFATSRPFMHHPDRKPLHDVMTCIHHQTTLHKAKTRLLGNGERHLKQLHELGLLWKERPDLLKRTVQISNRLQFSLSELEYQYPQLPLPDLKASDQFLRELVYKGIKERYPNGCSSKIIQTVEHELALIHELKYEDYFLTLWDICQFAKQRNILHQGRGSAANSIVCFALGLTAVDPTQVSLLFERFLSKERGEPPDIDIDFESGRREEVIQYIYQKYGSRHAAMVCTLICYRSRMALREAAKVFSIPPSTIDRMVRTMGREGLKYLFSHPELAKEWGFSELQFKRLLEIARQLHGVPRHLGIHTGGFLISQRPITECVPVEKATMENRYVVQWNKDDLATLKMMKIDVLGLGMLTALQKCFELLKTHKSIDLKLYQIPQEDPKTYQMIQKADTVGVFQIESRAQMSLLPRLKPKTFYDLVVEVAIVRPGPLQGGMVHPYIRRRHGLEPVHYAHPKLKPILSKTFGVPIFQEQIMQIASTVCGFTPGEADELRRIMSSSWNNSEAMKGLRTRLINGMLDHKISLKYAEQIYQTIIGFASYGFPESHAASFALITYASCYLKCHHPEVFVCALLNSQPMGFYSPRALIQDAQRHSIRFLPLDVQHSEFDYSLEGSSVRLGFRALFGVQMKHVEKLLQARKEEGPFKSLEDLARRSKAPRPLLMSMAASGALSCFDPEVRSLLWKIQALNLDPYLLQAPLAKIEKNLFPQESEWEQMLREYKWQGFSIDRHPVKIVRPFLSPTQDPFGPFRRAQDLKNIRHHQKIRVAGLLSLHQRPPTAKGFSFLTIEDETGLINVILEPQVYQQHRTVLQNHSLLELCGRLQSVDGVIHLKSEIIRPLFQTLEALNMPNKLKPHLVGQGFSRI